MSALCQFQPATAGLKGVTPLYLVCHAENYQENEIIFRVGTKDRAFGCKTLTDLQFSIHKWIGYNGYYCETAPRIEVFLFLKPISLCQLLDI